MNKLLLCAFTTIIFSANIFAADCMKTATTQLDMNLCAKSNADAADKQLNQIYKQALASVKNDKNATEMLRQSERAWIKYRDAEINMYYPPKPDMLVEYGSFHPVCVSGLYEELTKSRIAALQRWLKKPVEGELCR